AAWLTKGQAPGSFGRLVQDYVRLSTPSPRWVDQCLAGRIAYVDHFGNLISNLTTDHINQVRKASRREAVSIRVAGISFTGLVSCYEAGTQATPKALINSNGQLEIFVKGGNAAELLKCSRGEPIELI
ncbi:MAG: SAM-dependent chlorinase/fluorinase, partial [Actinobacteria bacterium]|nr:SAM-dependent chlorinase/fluorinase [Actinomycetota bacterium]